MDDVDRALEAIRVQIKKEIVDNYFAGRVELEEETRFLEEEAAAYRENLAGLHRVFWALYEALGDADAIRRVMDLLTIAPWPAYDEYLKLSPADRAGLLRGRPRLGFTAWRRHRCVVFHVYQELVKMTGDLAAQYGKILSNLRLLNEDIDKFNLSFDFGLIAAQIEAMEGGAATIGGGLISGEREELSTRMRFKRRTLTNEQLPPPPVLKPLAQVQERLSQLL